VQGTEINKRREPYLWESLLAIGFLMVVVSYTLIVLKGDPQIPFVIAMVFTSLIALRTGITWAELEKGIISSLTSVISAVLILMVVGMVIGAWIQGGIVPTLIYYGLQLISPRYFLVTICLVCCVVSVATGSSWTTAGTLGIAAIGVAQGLGIPAGMTAGAIVAGSYFGDKMSPLSDTTNLASAVSGADIFDHVKHMMYTTMPSLAISCGLYLYLGLRYSTSQDASLDKVNLILTTLSDNFFLHPLLLLPAFAVVLMIVFKFPALPGIMGVAVLGSICAILWQGASLAEVVQVFHYGFEGTTGVEAVDSLLTRGGLDDMMWTVSLIMSAVAFGGVLEGSGMLKVLVNKLLQFVKSDGTLILLTLLSCIIINIVAVDNYLAMVVTAKMFQQAYKKRNLDPVNLSRCLEDSATITSPLIPWNTCGVVVYGLLGISAWEYAPYAFLNWITPIISAIYGYTGFTIKKIDEVQQPL
jgi:NhaC family Na+:H+ antiporter